MSTIDDINKGDVITFRSKSQIDGVLWRGVVKGRDIDYDTARRFSDVIGYHAEVLKHDQQVPAKETLDYFLIKLSEIETGAQQLRAFAVQWVDGDITVLDETNAVTIKVYDMRESDQTDFLDMLRAKGYYVEVA